MRLITLLNHCERFSGFVYEKARLCQESRTIEIEMRPRRGSKPVCSGCHERGRTYDHLRVRRFEFVPLWGFMVLLLYCMRRVDCRACGVRVEEVPWATGKHQLPKAYMLFLAHWVSPDVSRIEHMSEEELERLEQQFISIKAKETRQHKGSREKSCVAHFIDKFLRPPIPSAALREVPAPSNGPCRYLALHTPMLSRSDMAAQ